MVNSCCSIMSRNFLAGAAELVKAPQSELYRFSTMAGTTCLISCQRSSATSSGLSAGALISTQWARVDVASWPAYFSCSSDKASSVMKSGASALTLGQRSRTMGQGGSVPRSIWLSRTLELRPRANDACRSARVKNQNALLRSWSCMIERVH